MSSEDYIGGVCAQNHKVEGSLVRCRAPIVVRFGSGQTVDDPVGTKDSNPDSAANDATR